MDVNAEPEQSKIQGPPIPDSAAADAVFVQVRAANARLMERTPFAIDDVGDEEEESEDELKEGEDDDQVMDEVRFILWILLRDTLPNPCFLNRWMRSLKHMIPALQRQIRRLRMVCSYLCSCACTDSFVCRFVACGACQVIPCFTY